MKKTPWFPVSIEPVHVGWYEGRYEGCGHLKPVLQYWNGKNWGRHGQSSFGRSPYFKDKWRGMTKPAAI